MTQYNELDVVKKDDRGETVKLLQAAINGWLSSAGTDDNPLVVDGDFGGGTKCYVQGFQAMHEGVNGQSLVIDGVVGAQSWFALAEYHPDIEKPAFIPEAVAIGALAPLSKQQMLDRLPAPETTAGPLAHAALVKAASQIGFRETGGPNLGPEVEQYQRGPASHNGATGRAWCASFVSWCYWQASTELSTGNPLNYTASSRNIETQMGGSGSFFKIESTDDLTRIKPGDILIWYRCGKLNNSLGHVGFIHSYDRDNAELLTIEGNKRNRVYSGRYRLSDTEAPKLIRGLIGFGRFDRGVNA